MSEQDLHQKAKEAYPRRGTAGELAHGIFLKAYNEHEDIRKALWHVLEVGRYLGRLEK